MNKKLYLLMLLFVVACAPVKIPTADVTPTVVSTPTPSATRVLAASPTSVTTPAPTPTNGPEGGTITIGVVGNWNGDVNALPQVVQTALYDSLLQIDPVNGALKPGLAEKYQVSNDALTITFYLRAGVRWHNGDPFTADDVVATLKAFSDPNFRGTPLTDFGTFTRATALDAQTVQLAFSDAYCPALTSIGTLKILPRAVAASANFPRLTAAQWIGTGPLKFVSQTNDQINFERNANYFGGAPHIDLWTVRMFADGNALRAAFNAKQIDVMSAPANDYAALKTFPNLVSVDSPEAIEMLFNTDTPTLNDPRVRQALTYALDRNVLLNDLGGQARPLDAATLPGFWAFANNLPRYAFDLAQAKQLLADAGWRDSGDGILKKNGKPMTLELWTEADEPQLEPLAFRIREMDAALGIQVTLQLDDHSGWITRAFAHRFDLLLLKRKLPLDPDQRWYWQTDQNAKGSGFNFGSYASPKVDSLFKASAHTPQCDPAARATSAGEIDRQLLTDAPAVFLFSPKKYMVLRERAMGIAPSPFAGDYWNLNTWRVNPQ